eukprot:gene4795-9559_t
MEFTEVADCLRYDPKIVSITAAAKTEDWGMTIALLRQGVSINSTVKLFSDKGAIHHELYSPLIAAAAYGHIEYIKKLFDMQLINEFVMYHIDLDEKCYRIDINMTNLLGQSALIYAAARGDEELVLFLIRNGADRYLKDIDGFDAVAWANKMGQKHVVPILQADPSRQYVHEAVRSGDFSVTIGYLKQGINPNQHRYTKLPNDNSTTVYDNDDTSFVVGETPLGVAATYGHQGILYALLRCPDILVNLPDCCGCVPLFLAAVHGHEEAVLLLLQYGADRDIFGYFEGHGLSALEVARYKGYENIQYILQSDPLKSSLHVACEEGQIEVVIALLKQHVDILCRDERTDKKCQTVLINRLSMFTLNTNDDNDNVVSVSDLCDAKDTDGCTALMMAAQSGQTNITGLLLSIGANRDIRDIRGLTAAQYAAKHGYITAMNTLCFADEQVPTTTTMLSKNLKIKLANEIKRDDCIKSLTDVFDQIQLA